MFLRRASALIALLDRDDAGQERCVEALKGIRDPLVTVSPAVTEAMHLLAGTPRAPDALCDLIADDAVRLVTFDRDFEVYRLPRRARFTVLPGRRS